MGNLAGSEERSVVFFSDLPWPIPSLYASLEYIEIGALYNWLYILKLSLCASTW